MDISLFNFLVYILALLTIAATAYILFRKPIYCIRNGLFKFYIWHQIYYFYHFYSSGYVKSPSQRDMENIIWDLRYKMEKGKIPTPPFFKVSNYLMSYWKIDKHLINDMKNSSFNTGYYIIKEFRKKVFFQCYIIALKYHVDGIYVD